MARDHADTTGSARHARKAARHGGAVRRRLRDEARHAADLDSWALTESVVAALAPGPPAAVFDLEEEVLTEQNKLTPPAPERSQAASLRAADRPAEVARRRASVDLVLDFKGALPPEPVKSTVGEANVGLRIARSTQRIGRARRACG